MQNIPLEIANFYKKLESITTFDRWDLMKQINPMKEMFEYEWNIRLSAEHLCMRFTLHGGELISDFYSVDKNGKEIGIPTFDIFSNEQIGYLKARAENVINPFMIARYNHVLFCVCKNQKYAIQAINAYKQLINNNPSDDDFDRCIPSIEAIIKLTEKVKFNVVATKSEIYQILHNSEVKIQTKKILAHHIINSSLFKSNELKELSDLYLDWLDQLEETDYHIKKDILNDAIRICINNGINCDKYFEKLAENEFFILNQHSEDSDFLKTHTLSLIAEYYKKAKNAILYEKYIGLYTKAKAQINLHKIDVSPDKDDQRLLNEFTNNRLKELLTWDLDAILKYYSTHSQIFPDIDEIQTIGKKRYEKSILKHITNSVFDINNNIKTLSDDESQQQLIYTLYMYSFSIGILMEFVRFMQVGTYNRKISYQHVYTYLDKNSWYGQEIAENKMRNGESSTTYKWLNLMAPALHSLFIQLESSFLISNERIFTNWVLPIDSLTLKFEGALRDFIRFTGGNSITFKRNEFQEMLIDDLLNSETAKRIFSNNDLTLFKMIFTKRGDNIRHNVAHGFYHPKDYTMEKCCKIFLCILRLSNYKLVEKAEDNE